MAREAFFFFIVADLSNYTVTHLIAIGYECSPTGLNLGEQMRKFFFKQVFLNSLHNKHHPGFSKVEIVSREEKETTSAHLHHFCINDKNSF